MVLIEKIDRWVERMLDSDEHGTIGWVETLVVVVIAIIATIGAVAIHIVTYPYIWLKRKLSQSKLINEFITYFFK